MSWLRNRQAFEKEEAQRLAPVAVKSAESRGRLVAEPEHPYRTAFQRDRDRIVHSRAFRRLEYKTQVFVYHEDDHYRNRLTHTLEGAQIARTIARALRLNEELAEAVALVHDVGHTPFGHAGERVLAELMRDDGGFDHNRQTLRTVDWLEERYPGFRGLNLTQETREGILKHGAPWSHPVSLPPLGAQRCLEGQAADVADEIAYTNHDLDDGLRSKLLTLDMLDDVRLWGEARRHVDARLGLGGASESVRRSQTIIALINGLVTDVVETTAARLAGAGAESVDAVRAHSETLLAFSDPVERDKLELKRFLLENLYQHPQVLHMTRRAEVVVGDLYRVFRGHAGLLPETVRQRFADEGEARAVADYVAGMTDRFATAEHEKHVGAA
ncbi:MAG: deoxyguanosinetriphosphate triphosphohydrolase [Proteobacteria bacterium]|nr:deoxyguanosinetriphosphate triphosphohydrolase [Pseudomonadota bacterium]MCZ6785273.1 deoxyguanosinetriphosphate triphosphohydrolase [Pseudomonadota bacterium]